MAAGLLLRPHLRARRRPGADRGRTPDGRARLSALEPARDLHARRARPGLADRPFVTIARMAIGDVMRTRVVTVEPGRLGAARRPAHARGGSRRRRGLRRREARRHLHRARRARPRGRRHRPRRRPGRRRDDARPFTVDARAAVLDAARLMGEQRIRHLPVVEGEHLLGMVGIRDVLGSLVERLWQTHDTAAHETARALFTTRLGRQPFRRPAVAVALVADAVVQPVVAVLPELVRVRDERGSRPSAAAAARRRREAGCGLGVEALELGAVGERPALRRGPRGEAARRAGACRSRPPTPRPRSARRGPRRAPGGRAAASGRAEPRAGSPPARRPCGSPGSCRRRSRARPRPSAAPSAPTACPSGVAVASAIASGTSIPRRAPPRTSAGTAAAGRDRGRARPLHEEYSCMHPAGS